MLTRILKKIPFEHGNSYETIKYAKHFGHISVGNGFKTQQWNLLIHYIKKNKSA